VADGNPFEIFVKDLQEDMFNDFLTFAHESLSDGLILNRSTGLLKSDMSCS